MNHGDASVVPWGAPSTASVAEREAEDLFFREGMPPEVPLETICSVEMVLSNGAETTGGAPSRTPAVIVNFCTKFQRYSIFVIVKNLQCLEWRECRAIASALAVAERGTKISDTLFTRFLTQFESEFGHCREPTVVDGALCGRVYPPESRFQVTEDMGITRTALTSDDHMNLIVEGRTKGDMQYSVRVQPVVVENPATSRSVDFPSLPTPAALPGPPASSLSKADCRVLKYLLLALAPAEIVSPDKFQAIATDLRLQFNSGVCNELRNAREEVVGYYMDVVPSYTQPALPTPSMNPLHGEFRRLDLHDDVCEVRNTHEYPQPPLPRYEGIEYTAEKLKASGQATVCRGRYRRYDGDVDVVIKIFDQTEVYMQELMMLLSISHDNVIKVVACFETPKPALIMPYVDGPDLFDYLKELHNRNERLSSQCVRQFAQHIASGLQALHSKNIVHRDVKSGNILVKNRGRDPVPVIIDLGFGAKIDRRFRKRNTAYLQHVSTQLSKSSSLQVAKSHVGTYLWMAPEMISSCQWSEKTDVYSFGILLWELCTARVPFSDPNTCRIPRNILFQIYDGTRPPLTEVSDDLKDLKDLMEKCWHKDPKKRPTMRTVVDILGKNDPLEIFNRFDGNNDGHLSFPEFSFFLEDYDRDIRYERYSQIFKAVDVNNDGTVEVDEFLSFWQLATARGLDGALDLMRTDISITNSVRQESMESPRPP